MAKEDDLYKIKFEGLDDILEINFDFMKYSDLICELEPEKGSIVYVPEIFEVDKILEFKILLERIGKDEKLNPIEKMNFLRNYNNLIKYFGMLTNKNFVDKVGCDFFYIYYYQKAVLGCYVYNPKIEMISKMTNFYDAWDFIDSQLKKFGDTYIITERDARLGKTINGNITFRGITHYYFVSSFLK